MDLLRAKIYLDKINREFTRMLKDPENIPRIDVDITMSYIREMYEAFQAEAPERIHAPAPRAVAAPVVEPKPAPVVAPPVVVAPPPPPPVVEPKPVPPPPVVVAPVVEPPPPVVVAPPPVEEPKPAPPPPVVVAPVEPPPPPPPVVVAPPVEKPAPAAVVSSDDADVLFEYKEAKELSEKLSETPISDIKRAIALNDRLLLQRELFGGDHGFFEEVLTALNHFSGFEQAKSYLLQECIGRFDWMHKTRIDTAKSFIRLVRRRYK